MAQHPFGRKQAGVLVEDAAHVLVGRNEALHQHVGVPRDHGGHRHPDAVYVHALIDDLEGVDIDVFLAADLFDDAALTVERRLDEPLAVGFIDGLKSMRILAVGHGQPFFAPLSRLLDDFGKVLDHGIVDFKWLFAVICG